MIDSTDLPATLDPDIRSFASSSNCLSSHDPSPPIFDFQAESLGDLDGIFKFTHCDARLIPGRSVSRKRPTAQRKTKATRSIFNPSIILLLISIVCLVFLSTQASATPVKWDSSSQADPWTSYDHQAPAFQDAHQHVAQPLAPTVSHALGDLSTAVKASVGDWLHAWKVSKVRRGRNAEIFWGSLRAWARGEDQNVKMMKRALSTAEKVEAALIPVLVLLSGLFAGLTLGYFSIDPTQLNVLAISGTPKQQAHAKRIQPVRKNGHLLLTTLLLANMVVNETLPEISNGPLGGGFQAVVVSTVLIVIFAEIIPQSICSRYGLWVGAKAAPLVRVLIYALFIFAYPVAKVLEWSLGAHHGIIYRRSELKELIKIHAAGGENGGDLDNDTVIITQGALGLQDKVAKDVMTPIDSVFMLPITAKLDYETLGEVVRSGHSRIPVYQDVEVPNIEKPGHTRVVKKILGCLLVKSCILLDPEDATPLSEIPINTIPAVPWDEPLTNMLNTFQEGRSHMAIISRRGRHLPQDDADAESVMSSTAIGMRRRILKKIADKVKSFDSSSSGESDDEGSGSATEEGRNEKTLSQTQTASTATKVDLEKGTRKREKKKRGDKKEPEKTGSGRFVEAAKLQPQEQILPADAQLAGDQMEKFFEGLEGAPLGIVTLEDVLEALIGEAIADEYDFDEGSHEPLEASQYVPPEAAAAAKAAADLRLALASQTPLPSDADQGLLTPSAETPGSRKMPKISLLKFSMRRSASTPGRKRSPGPLGSSTVGSMTPAVEVLSPTEERTGSPEPLTDEPEEQPSQVKFGPTVETASAIPTRLVASSSDRGRRRMQTTPSPAPNALPAHLSEAVLIERERRRGPSSGGAHAASLSVVAPQATVIQPGGGITIIRGSTPDPVSKANAKKAAPGTEASEGSSAGVTVLSPQPRRTPRFKSVQSSATPVGPKSASTPVDAGLSHGEAQGKEQ